MLSPGPAVKLTVFLNQDTEGSGGFLPDEILRFLHDQGVQGATAFRPLEGFGSHQQMHTRGGGTSGWHLPVMIQFVERREKFESIRAQLLAMVTDGLVEVQATEVLKHASGAARVVS